MISGNTNEPELAFLLRKKLHNLTPKERPCPRITIPKTRREQGQTSVLPMNEDKDCIMDKNTTYFKNHV